MFFYTIVLQLGLALLQFSVVARLFRFSSFWLAVGSFWFVFSSFLLVFGSVWLAVGSAWLVFGSFWLVRSGTKSATGSASSVNVQRNMWQISLKIKTCCEDEKNENT